MQRPAALLVICALFASGAWIASGALVNLLPEEPLELFPDSFEDASKACTSAHILRATFDEFALPAVDGTAATTLAFHFRGSVDCPASTQGFSTRAALFGFGVVDVLLDCRTPTLVLNGGVLGRLLFPLPQGFDFDAISFTLGIDPGAAFPAKLCVSGSDVQGNSALGAGLVEYLQQSRALLASGVGLGARSGAQRSARASFAEFWLETGGRQACQPLWGQDFATLAAVAAANHAPSVAALEQQPAGEVFVGDAVRFKATASDVDNDPLRLSITFFGVPPEDCTAAACGDKSVQIVNQASPALLEASLQFPRPGRFVVRVQASDGSGAVTTHDHAVLVRKLGDAGRQAPCCRHTPYVSASAIGRPIDHTVYRPAAVYQAAQQRLGWSREYMDGADLEAERLFDYAVLAPRADDGPLRTLSCADSRLAGAGSPLVYGFSDAFRNEVSGHNKVLAVVPAGFAWANASDVECQQHWSGWQEGSPYARRNAQGEACSVACTKAGTEQLIRTTGMFDQYNQALIQNSMGALSLSPAVTVLDEVLIGPDPLTPGDDSYAYYEAPAQRALAARQTPRWMYIVLVPLSYRRPPPNRAFSGGLASQGAVITTCYATMYYAVHETGHRLGFHHANVYRLAQAALAPTDPLGPGSFESDSYDDRLDVMSCCKSDYGLFHRTLAGWLKGSERLVLDASDLQQSGTRRLVLWPFDRSESRGRLASVALRRTAREVLLVGFRSASHWQETGSGGLPPEETRQNVRGLQVEYLRKEEGQWSERGLLDFNVLHGDWPHALPGAPGAAPRLSQFALLKEGYSWYDPGSATLISLERLAECDGPGGLPPHPHSARGFYGFRGDWPFRDTFSQADYLGYAGLQCAHLVVRTAAPPPPPDALELSLTVTAPAAAAANPSTAGSCSLQPAAALTVTWPHGVQVESVVWKDATNVTLLAEAPALGQTRASLPAAQLPASVHVLAADGRHSRAAAVASGADVTVQYKMYGLAALRYREEKVPHGLVVLQQCTPAGKRNITGLLVGVTLASVAVGVGAVVLSMLALRWCAARRRQRKRQSEADAAAALAGGQAEGGDASAKPQFDSDK